MWNITFAHSGALWLVAGASVPLIIHLLSRQKPRVINFPAVRFIRQSRQRSLRRTRLRHLLLLLMRMALIALLALLIARPSFRRSGAGAVEAGAGGTPAAVLVVDDSLSMCYRTGDVTCFDRARSRALNIIQALPAGTAIAVLTTSHPQGKLDRRLDSVIGRIQGLRPGTRANACWNALEAASELLQETGASRRDIVILTDMTTGAWLGHERREVTLGDRVNVFLVDCSADEPANGAIYELRHEGQPPMLGAHLTLNARVLASGAAQKRTVQFSFDGETVTRQEIAVEAAEETTLHLRVPLTSSGHHWGQVAFLNPDGLPLDDVRSFTVDVAPDVSVLVVEDDPDTTTDSVSFFLRLALDPWGQDRRAIFRVERASPRDLETLPLGPVDVVVLVGAGGMTPEAWRRLHAYVSSGGGVLTFLGPETGATYADEDALSVLPAVVNEEVKAPPDLPFRLRTISPAHPLMAALRESGADLAQVRFRRCRGLEPVADAQELMSFGPDMPALVLREAGGRVLLFAGTADERWGDFAATPSFVPFCHESVLYLAGRAVGTIASFSTGAQVPILFQPSRWPTIVYVTPPRAAGPERLLPGTTPGRRTYWKTDEPGYYRVGFEQHGKTWPSGFAVNAPAIESRLEQVPFEVVKERISAGKVEMLAHDRLAGAGIAGGGWPTELTPYVALLALALMVGEGFLANRFYRPQSG